MQRNATQPKSVACNEKSVACNFFLGCNATQRKFRPLSLFSLSLVAMGILLSYRARMIMKIRTKLLLYMIYQYSNFHQVRNSQSKVINVIRKSCVALQGVARNVFSVACNVFVACNAMQRNATQRLQGVACNALQRHATPCNCFRFGLFQPFGGLLS